MTLNIQDLNGPSLKRELNAFRVTKRYHNKHTDGSGNFGFTLRFKREKPYMSGGAVPILMDEDWFDLHGDYGPTGDIFHIAIGAYISAGVAIVAQDYAQLINTIKCQVAYIQKQNIDVIPGFSPQ